MKTKLISVLILTGICLACCKKENKSPIDITKQKLAGKWYNTTTTLIHSTFGLGLPPDTTTTISQNGEYYDFMNDGKLVMYTTGLLDTITYQVVNDTLISTGQSSSFIYDHYDIKILTDTSLRLYSKVLMPGHNNYEPTLDFKR